MTKSLCYFFLLWVQFINPAVAEEKEIIAKITIGWYFPSINSLVSKTDFKIALDFWLTEFNQSLDFQVTESRLFDQIDKMQVAFSKGELTFIIAPPLLLVKHFDLNTLADGFVATNLTGKPYGMAVLSRRDKNINQIKDFKNKRLVLPENDELAKDFLSTLTIPLFHQNYQQTFSSVQYLQKQNAIIHSLFFDKADVGVAYLETFDLMVELNPQINEKIKILANFPIDSPNYTFFHHQFPEDKRKKFIAEALKLNKSVRARQIFSSFRMAELTKCPVNSLEPFIQLNHQYKQLMKGLQK